MTQENKVAELMKPRYNVIADYPGSKFRIGDILEHITGAKENWYNLRIGSTFYIEPMTYPSIFKKLEWWEDRKPEEMPEYVKMMDGPVKGTVRKMSELEFPYHVYYKFLPATKSDYDQYIKQKI